MTLVPFQRYDGIKVENRQFLPTPPYGSTPSLGVTPFEFRDEHLKTRIMGLSYGEETMIAGRTMWTQSTSVTDRQTDRQIYDN